MMLVLLLSCLNLAPVLSIYTRDFTVNKPVEGDFRGLVTLLHAVHLKDRGCGLWSEIRRDQITIRSAHVTSSDHVTSSTSCDDVTGTLVIWNDSDFEDNNYLERVDVYKVLSLQPTPQTQIIIPAGINSKDITDNPEFKKNVNIKEFKEIPHSLARLKFCNVLWLGVHRGACSFRNIANARSKRQVQLGLRFAENPYEDSFPEDMPSGAPIMTVMATTLTETSTITYSLITTTHGSSRFKINPSSGIINLETHLDYEENSVIMLSVLAETDTYEKAITEVILHVEDANDNAPVFVRDEYLFSVLDSTPIGSYIGSVYAGDLDSSSNGLIRYSVSEAEDGAYFRVNSETGYLNTRQSLNVKARYSLVIEACDRGTPSLKTNVTVTVYIQNTTSNPGSSPPRFGSRGYSHTISELGRPGRQVYRVRADPDTAIQYSIIQGSTPAQNSPIVFQINPTSGVITREALTDHDGATPVYNLLVKVRTTQLPAYEDFTQVRIALEDVNDNVPMFSQSRYLTTVLENVATGTYVTTVHATDRDSAYNGAITYSTPETSFSVDYRLGHIYTAVKLDREKTNKYSFFVLATDNGTIPQNSGVNVQVTVLDINDCKPVFRSPVMEVFVKEDTAVGDLVTTLTSLDQDEGINAAVTYSFISGDTDKFLLDGGTGIVTVNTELDYETVQEYRINVQATDGKFYDNGELVIKVEDVNDHYPVFEQDVYTLSVLEDITVGSRLLHLQATDGDTGTTPLITYKMTQLTPFSVDSATGWFSVSGIIDREVQEVYDIIVTAVDSGGLESTTKIAITILDINDNAPLCPSGAPTHLPENAPRDHHVTRLSASDPDEGDNAVLSFSLVNLQDVFYINITTGDIYVLTGSDREETPQLELLVKVQDSGAPAPLSTQCSVIVVIDDENDNWPVCSQLAYRFSVSELAAIGDSVQRLDCTDEDGSRNGELEYTILSGNNPSSFDIHPRTGELSVIRHLNYTELSLYKLVVQVSDRSPPFFNVTVKVEVEVTDSNDDPPLFDEPEYHIELTEDFSPGVPIMEVTARDSDPAQTITYTLTDTIEDLFRIDTVKGVCSLVLMREVDREVRESYVLELVATDDGTPVLSSSTTLYITVMDVNNNHPVVLENLYEITTTPQAKIGTTLLALTVTDEDGLGNGAPFTSTVLSGNEEGIFGLEGLVLRLKEPVKLVASTTYTLTVKVTDAGSPPLSSTTTVNIRVLSEDLYAPVTTTTKVALPLLNNALLSDVIVEYRARDQDRDSVLVYTLEDDQSNPGFVMYSNGTLISLTPSPPLGGFRLRVYVSDGVHREVGYILLQVYSLNSAAAQDPLTLRLTGVRKATFNRELFSAVLAQILKTSPEDIIIISTEDKTTRRRAAQLALELTLMSRDSEGRDMSRVRMLQLLSRDIVTLQDRTGYMVDALDTDPCLREPCPLSAVCSAVTGYYSASDSSSEVRAVTTAECHCRAGYTGTRCEETMPCYTSPCSNGGVCHVTQAGLEECRCGPHYTGPRCGTPVKHCLSSPCLNSGLCIDNDPGYTCRCQPGYRGDDCQTSILVTGDLCASSTCSKFSTCTAGRDHVTCTCSEGWAGEHCTYKTDTPAPCSTNPCKHGGACEVDKSGSPTCECGPGFSGAWCEVNVDDCLGAPCHNGGSCVDGIDGFLCTCPAPYSGTTCQHVTSPCDVTPCLHGGQCHAAGEGYLCLCDPGYVGDHCQTSLLSPAFCDPSPCSEHTAICTSGLLSYTCTCNIGYTGPTCATASAMASDCELNPCYNGGRCISQSTGYLPFTCKCEEGFTGLNCEEDINECSGTPCQNGGKCVDKIATYQCICVAGYTGRDCQVSTDPCLSLPCRNGGQCRSVEDSYVCRCPAAYTGRNCETLLTSCPDNHCQNGGQCGAGSDGMVRCSCRADYIGEYCQHRYKYCTLETCLNSGRCIEGTDGYRCECGDGFKGPNCELTDLFVQEGGHVAITPPVNMKETVISFKIRTRSARGVVAYIGRYGGGQDYLLLQLKQEQLHLTFSVGRSRDLSVSVPRVVADRKWHVVTLRVSGKQITLIVDECHRTPTLSCYTTTTVPGSYYSLDTNTPLYLGGIDYNYPYLPSSLYNGCISDVYLDGILVDLSQVVSSSLSTPGCLELDCKSACKGTRECRTEGGSVSCQCPPGVTGTICNIPSPAITIQNSPVVGSYNTAGFLDTSYFDLSIQLRTRIPHCLLLTLGSRGADTLTLTLVSGSPRATYVTQGVAQSVTLYQTAANDGRWHTVRLSKVLDQLHISLDDIYQSRVRLSDVEMRSNSKMLFSVGGVGGGLVVQDVSSSGYIGCIRDLRVSSAEVSLYSGDHVTGDVTIGCSSPQSCLHSTCPPTHRCSDIWGDYTCICPDDRSGPDCNCPAGYTGTQCQYEVDECAASPCLHSTECRNRAGGPGYTCVCKPGYTGANCDRDINECVTSSHPVCLNGGACLDRINGVECRCPYRYTGDRCEVDSTPCADSPCLHGGKCSDLGGGVFTCQCSVTWGGDTCQVPRSCDINPCINGGKCKDTGSEYVQCKCKDNWIGYTCQEIDCDSCNNGACYKGSCVCDAGFTGPTCQEEEQRVREISAPIETWVIVLVAILGCLLVIVIITIVICRKKCYPDTKYQGVPRHPAGLELDGGGGTTPLHSHPYYHPPPLHSPQHHQLYNKYSPFQYGHFESDTSNMLQMTDLNQSTATLDNEIKL